MNRKELEKLGKEGNILFQIKRKDEHLRDKEILCFFKSEINDIGSKSVKAKKQ